MSALWLDNLLAYSLQFGVLVLSAVLAAWALGVRAPKVTLRLWQALSLVAIGLPVIQPWATTSASSVASSLTFAVAAIAPAFPPPDRIAFPSMILLIIFAGAGFRLGWLALGLIRLKALKRDSIALDPMPEFIDDLQRRLGTRASVRISDELEGPATIGSTHAVVLIPRRVLDLPPAIQRAIFCHELLHVKRRDWRHTLAEEAGCALLWFHPAARLLASRLSLARESVVDLMTVAQTMDRRSYAEALIAFADASAPRVATVTPFIRRRHLAQRLSLVLQEVPMSRSRITVATTACVALAALATAATVFNFPLATTITAQEIYQPRDGVTLPRVLKEVKPQYTPEAMKAKIQGSVWLSIVVLPSGDVGDVRVTRSLDTEYGLDNEAIKAAGQWKFQPGTKDGKPVPVQVTLELTFTLKK
jgi:TonB family protein